MYADYFEVGVDAAEEIAASRDRQVIQEDIAHIPVGLPLEHYILVTIAVEVWSAHDLILKRYSLEEGAIAYGRCSVHERIHYIAGFHVLKEKVGMAVSIEIGRASELEVGVEAAEEIAGCSCRYPVQEGI